MSKKLEGLTWEEKLEIYDEVKRYYDKENAKSWASVELTDEQAEAAADEFDRNYSCDAPEYDQMRSAIERVLNAVA